MLNTPEFLGPKANTSINAYEEQRAGLMASYREAQKDGPPTPDVVSDFDAAAQRIEAAKDSGTMSKTQANARLAADMRSLIASHPSEAAAIRKVYSAYTGRADWDIKAIEAGLASKDQETKLAAHVQQKKADMELDLFKTMATHKGIVAEFGDPATTLQALYGPNGSVIRARYAELTRAEHAEEQFKKAVDTGKLVGEQAAQGEGQVLMLKKDKSSNTVASFIASSATGLGQNLDTLRNDPAAWEQFYGKVASKSAALATREAIALRTMAGEYIGKYGASANPGVLAQLEQEAKRMDDIAEGKTGNTVRQIMNSYSDQSKMTEEQRVRVSTQINQAISAVGADKNQWSGYLNAAFMAASPDASVAKDGAARLAQLRREMPGTVKSFEKIAAEFSANPHSPEVLRYLDGVKKLDAGDIPSRLNPNSEGDKAVVNISKATAYDELKAISASSTPRTPRKENQHRIVFALSGFNPSDSNDVNNVNRAVSGANSSYDKFLGTLDPSTKEYAQSQILRGIEESQLLSFTEKGRTPNRIVSRMADVQERFKDTIFEPSISINNSGKLQIQMKDRNSGRVFAGSEVGSLSLPIGQAANISNIQKDLDLMNTTSDVYSKIRSRKDAATSDAVLLRSELAKSFNTGVMTPYLAKLQTKQVQLPVEAVKETPTNVSPMKVGTSKEEIAADFDSMIQQKRADLADYKEGTKGWERAKKELDDVVFSKEYELKKFK